MGGNPHAVLPWGHSLSYLSYAVTSQQTCKLTCTCRPMSYMRTPCETSDLFTNLWDDGDSDGDAAIDKRSKTNNIIRTKLVEYLPKFISS